MHLTDLAWPRVDAMSRDIPVIVPVAAMEQHGHHLPLFTDSMLLREVVRRVSGTLGDRALFTPLLWIGNSDHHLDFPGTLSAPPRTYLDLLNGIAENLLQHGFKRLVFLNGHGGNEVPGRQAVFELRQRHRQRTDLLLLFATYWSLGTGSGPAADLGTEQTEMGHACEWETSMILRLAPHLVAPHQNISPVPPGNPFQPASRGWTTRDRSAPGHIGSPHLATVEKGERLFQKFAQEATAFLERVITWDGRSWNG
ncbi:MAG: creatininase family protein [Verrucomicrobiales bacterium]|nr:creatininase family protein [Verrucomicrobiales bacterium]